MELYSLLLIPLFLALAALLIGRSRSFGAINALGYLAELSCGLFFSAAFLERPEPFTRGLFFVDSLTVFFVLVITIVAFAAALYSIGFLERERRRMKVTDKKSGYYYFLFNLFILAMLLATMVNNLGLLWVAIELTTLISAFLVGFYNTKFSVEAAWKYLIICSVGIILALLGTILFAYVFSLTGGISLNWSDLSAAAGRFDPDLVKLAFIFIIVGYGTKAGLAPMHTWLPDAHSQAISPASALLSGLLLKTALYAIIRYGLIVVKCVGFGFFSHLMLLFGLFSLLIAAGFVLAQKDLKRLLAYSSIEHIGIIAVGIGLGGPLALYGAFLHLLGHAAAKSLMFFGAGNIIQAYDRHNMSSIRGVIRVLPFTGLFFLAGLFALAGFPPFSLFRSEVMIIMAAFGRGSYLIAGSLLLFMTVIFGALVFHAGKMIFGPRPAEVPPAKEDLAGKLAFIFLLLIIVVLGVWVPGPLDRLLLLVVDTTRGI
ncbi:MAG: hydrogenase 4 subunit F [Candidatus Margulisbacteria bacterium]|nr:hydrogenase 4 subunit F [Candidatus Margulisiibacteriota bacterium]MBU1617811.1 hydrogenase 4 subunit F [Candidatus Margulisiibacteriota bacterium]